MDYKRRLKKLKNNRTKPKFNKKAKWINDYEEYKEKIKG